LPLPRDFSEDPGISLNPGIIVSKLTVKHDIFSDSKTLLDFWHFFQIPQASWRRPEENFPRNCQNFVMILVQKSESRNPVSNPNLALLVPAPLACTNACLVIRLEVCGLRDENFTMGAPSREQSVPDSEGNRALLHINPGSISDKSALRASE
jgi:hypothetical protein